MRGSIKQRSPGSWTLRVEAGTDSAGKRKQVVKTIRGTKKEAEKELAALVSFVANGGDPFPEKMTVEAFSRSWLESKVAQKRLRDSTAKRYRELLAKYVFPEIGAMELRKVKPAHVQAILDGMAARGLATRTALQTRAVIGGLMRRALVGGLIDVNPVTAVEPPMPQKPQLSVPGPMQLAALMRAARGTLWEIPILLAATTGARRSEVLAVRWTQTDLEQGHVRITQGLHRGVPGSDEPLVFLDPKTKRSERQIDLAPFVVERLRQHRREQAARKLRLGPAWVDLDLVSDRGDGAPLHPDAMSRAFKRLAESVGLPRSMRLHDIRHGVATTLLAKKVHPAIASAVLGHASPAFTMTAYQHVLDGMTQQAATAMHEALGGGQ